MQRGPPRRRARCMPLFCYTCMSRPTAARLNSGLRVLAAHNPFDGCEDRLWFVRHDLASVVVASVFVMSLARVLGFVGILGSNEVISLSRWRLSESASYPSAKCDGSRSCPRIGGSPRKVKTRCAVLCTEGGCKVLDAVL